MGGVLVEQLLDAKHMADLVSAKVFQKSMDQTGELSMVRLS